MENEKKLDEMTSIIQSLLKIHREISSEKKLKGKIEHTIKTLLSPDFWGEKHAVSLKAQEFAKNNGYTKPLELSSWDELGNKDLKVKREIKDKKRKHNGTRGLILEHIILRSDIMDLLFKCDIKNLNEIKEIVEHTRCAVIHWEEDDELTEDGYGDKRSDPKKAYEKINLIFPSGYKDISDFIDQDWVKERIESLYSK